MDATHLFGQTRAEVESQVEQLADGLASLDSDLRSMEATAVSADGLVEVTVGAGGQLRDLVLDPRVFRDPDSVALADTIVQTANAATEDAVAEAERITAAAFGAPLSDEEGTPA